MAKDSKPASAEVPLRPSEEAYLAKLGKAAKPLPPVRQQRVLDPATGKVSVITVRSLSAKLLEQIAAG